MMTSWMLFASVSGLFLLLLNGFILFASVSGLSLLLLLNGFTLVWYFVLCGAIVACVTECLYKKYLNYKAKASETKATAVALAIVVETMKSYIADQSKIYFSNKNGFLLKDYFDDLNKKFVEVDNRLRTNLVKILKSADHPQITKLCDDFRNTCADLSRELHDLYVVKLKDAYSIETKTGFDTLINKISAIHDVDALYLNADAILKETFSGCVQRMAAWSPSRYYYYILQYILYTHVYYMVYSVVLMRRFCWIR
jgi:hypothetical protein